MHKYNKSSLAAETQSFKASKIKGTWVRALVAGGWKAVRGWELPTDRRRFSAGNPHWSPRGRAFPFHRLESSPVDPRWKLDPRWMIEIQTFRSGFFFSGKTQRRTGYLPPPAPGGEGWGGVLNRKQLDSPRQHQPRVGLQENI